MERGGSHWDRGHCPEKPSTQQVARTVHTDYQCRVATWWCTHHTHLPKWESPLPSQHALLLATACNGNSKTSPSMENYLYTMASPVRPFGTQKLRVVDLQRHAPPYNSWYKEHVTSYHTESPVFKSTSKNLSHDKKRRNV